MSSLDNTLKNIYRGVVGLNNVDNTSDINKPISTATQIALDNKLNLTGGTLTGGLTGTIATFSGDVTANGVSISALNSSKFDKTGGILTGGITGTTATFSGPINANGGITGTTATLSGDLTVGGITGTTATFSGPINANGGITGTTATFSGVVTLPQITDLTKNDNTAATTSFVKTVAQNVLKNSVDLVSTTNHSLFNTYYNMSNSALLITHPSNFNFGTNNWTFETWIYVTDYNPTVGDAGGAIFDTRTNGSNNSNGIQIRLSTTGFLGYYFSSVGNRFSTLLGAKIPLNTWTHIVSQRSNNFIQFYVNGVYIDQLSFNNSLPSSNMIIGRVSDFGVNDTYYKYKGFISNIRVIKNTAFYSSNFTPPTVLTNVTNTVLLITNKNPLIDESGVGNTVNIEGTITYNNDSTWSNGIDSVIPTNNTRILMTGQTNLIENGIYYISGANILRSSDLPLGSNAGNIIIYIKSGSQYANTTWICTNLSGSDIVGTNGLTFSSVKTDNVPVSKITNLQTTLDSKFDKTGGILTGGITGTTATFSGPINAIGGITGTTGTFSGPINANGGITGTTGTFSGRINANGGITGTTATFSGPINANGGITGTTGTFSGLINANGGITGTTATFSGIITANGGITGTTATLTSDLTVLGRILCNLPNYIDNTAAKNAGIPIGALYRTGGIIKIRLDDIPPVITLLGNSTVTSSSGNQYTEPGITITDNVNLNLSVSVTSILKDSVELLTAPITVTNTSSYITYTNEATYVITYVGKDDVGNLSTPLQRTVNVIVPFTMTLAPMTISGFDTIYTTCQIRNMAYTNGTYMISINVTISSKTYPAYLTSTNGIDWSYNNYFVTYFSGLSLSGSVWGNVVGANNIFIIRMRDNTNLMYSFYSVDNGVSWTLDFTTTSNINSLASLTTINNLFFYSLWTSPFTLYTSLDGRNWTTTTGTKVAWYTKFAYGNGIYVAISRDGNVITSTNGTNWTANVALRGYVIESYDQVDAITFGNGKFVIANYDTYQCPPSGINYILYSTNGISWTKVELPYYNNQKLMGSSNYIGIRSLFYHKNKFIMQLYSNVLPDHVFTSSDGINWNIESYSFSTPLGWSHSLFNNTLFYSVNTLTKTGSSYYPYFINQ